MAAFQHHALVSEAFEILRELLPQELVAIPEHLRIDGEGDLTIACEL